VRAVRAALTEIKAIRDIFQVLSWKGYNHPMEKTGILLLNLGGPESLKAVRPFLYNLFSDRDIIPLGPPFLQKPIAWLISAFRASKTRKAYSLIGGGSPIRKITLEQARLLEKELSGSYNVRTFIGMRYWHPFIEETLQEARKDGIQRVIGLSLYPQFSFATTGSTEKVFLQAAREMGLRTDMIRSWHDFPPYIRALKERILAAFNSCPSSRPVPLLFSAHSLPVSFIEKGDPYQKQIKETIRLVMEGLREDGLTIPHYLCYQSRSGPVRWLEPSTEEMLHRLAEEGIKELLAVPISFVSDHIETLYEIDILYRDMAASLGINLRRVPSLNSSPLFISALGDLVKKYLIN
jgi:ferrochelatase